LDVGRGFESASSKGGNVQKRPEENMASWIESIVLDFIQQSPDNTMENPAKEQSFEEALVGFSKGDDPIYDRFKEAVGPFHWTPLEIFAKTYPGLKVSANELTIISWVMPQRKATRMDNQKETVFPAERWARARIYGEKFNERLRHHVATVLNDNGYAAVSPSLSPDWSTKKSEEYTLASTWSERHAAHASGLGTFGLCDGLITPVGKAMRTGSVVARIDVPATPRPYKSHTAYCLYLAEGLCGECIPRCPVDAISQSGHDKRKCMAHLRNATTDYVKVHYGFDGYGCGLCQTGVPCESAIPDRADLSKEKSVTRRGGRRA